LALLAGDDEALPSQAEEEEAKIEGVTLALLPPES
jgi:hypothetical protein